MSECGIPGFSTHLDWVGLFAFVMASLSAFFAGYSAGARRRRKR